MTASALSLEIERSPEALAAREAEWWALVSVAPAATPFQMPGWLLPWWRRLGDGELAAVLVRGERGLCGLAVFSIESTQGVRRLRWLGAGISDYLTALVAPERAGETWDLLVRGVAALLEEAGRATLDNVPDGDPLLGALERLPRPWICRRSVDAICSAAPLARAESPADRPRICQKAGAALRRLAHAGPVTFSDVGGPTAGAAADLRGPLMEALFELHGERWRARGGEGVMASGAVRAHHREASERLHDRGLLRLHALEHGGRTMGVFYGFHFRARIWMYLCGYAPSLARFSPGSILVDRARAIAQAEGADAMDFLRGQEAYKQRWRAFERRTWRIDITRAA